MNLKPTFVALYCLMLAGGCGSEPLEAPPAEPVVHENLLLNLWQDNLTAFGVYVPNEAAPPSGGRGRGSGPGQGEERLPPVYTVKGGEHIAQNPLYDYAFLNLEGRYDGNAVRAIAEGMRISSAVSRKSLIVRIPSLENAGVETTRDRITEIFEAGANGVTMPHVRNLEEARTIARMLSELGLDIWSPANPTGEKILMLMLEDPTAIEEVREIAEIEGISILACGIGSLTAAIARARAPEVEGRPVTTEEDRAAAEAMNMRVLEESKRVGIADMITANMDNVEQRVEEGFLALLMSGLDADPTIELGRAAAGRQ